MALKDWIWRKLYIMMLVPCRSEKLLLCLKRRSTFSDTGTFQHICKNKLFPLIKVKVSSRDPPYVPPPVKHLYNIRNRNTKRYGEVNAELQASVNELISNNQVQAVRNENRNWHGTGTKGWWNTVTKITGRGFNALNISSVINPVDLNLFFERISIDTVFSPWTITSWLYLFRKEMASPLLIYDSFEAYISWSERNSLLPVERFCTLSCSSCYQAF